MADAPHPGRSHPERGVTLEPGDVVFYRPAGVDRFVDLDPKEFDTAFPVVAAFAQALPYVLLADGDLWSSEPTRFKPWHHVSVFVGETTEGPREIGFGPATYDGISDGEIDTVNPAALSRRPLQRNGAFDFDVLRAPTPELGVAIVAASEAQVGTGDDDGVIYSTNGLLAFAFATKARMLPDSPARTTAMNLAYGTHVQSRNKAAAGGGPPEESCVTAVAKAVSEAADEPVTFQEPAPPGPLAAMLAYWFGGTEVATAIDAILNRIENAGTEVMLGELALSGATVGDLAVRLPSLRTSLERFRPEVPLFGTPITADMGRAREEYGRLLRDHTREVHAALAGTPGLGDAMWPDRFRGIDDGRPGPGRPDDDGETPYSPGVVVSTAEYLASVGVLADHFTDVGEATLEELGEIERAKAGVPNQEHLVASPAMLWDALVASQFSPVTGS